MLEQGRVGSSSGWGQESALCLCRRRLGMGQSPVPLQEEAGDRTGPPSRLLSIASSLAINSHNLGAGTIRAKGQESRSQSGVSGSRLPELCLKVTSS